MAVKLLLYAAVLFTGMMIFLLFKEPYTLHAKATGVNAPADIELFHARNFEIKPEGVSSIVNAQRIERYKNFDKFYTIDASHRTDTGLHGILTSNEAIWKDGVIVFMQNSQYERSDGIRLEGDAIVYDTKKEILSSDKPFIFTQSQSQSHGLSFVYQMKEGTISANTIHSFIQTGKK